MTTNTQDSSSVTRSLSSIVQRVASTLHLNGAAKREAGAPIRATDLLIQQHELIDALWKEFESAPGAKKAAVFERIAATLVAHDAIEREIFYPACEAALGKDDPHLEESLVEHGLVEFSIFSADRCKDGDYFESCVHVLKEVVQHHVKEEQDDLFPDINDTIKQAELLALGAKMEARFAKALQEDWRAGLRANLEQVLAGKTKTKAKAKAASPSSATKGAARVAHRKVADRKVAAKKRKS